MNGAVYYSQNLLHVKYGSLGLLILNRSSATILSEACVIEGVVLINESPWKC